MVSQGSSCCDISNFDKNAQIYNKIKDDTALVLATLFGNSRLYLSKNVQLLL